MNKRWRRPLGEFECTRNQRRHSRSTSAVLQTTSTEARSVWPLLYINLPSLQLIKYIANSI